MSNLLEQALVDAKALKEAAVKSAENELLEKYADEMRSAVSRLLEQGFDVLHVTVQVRQIEVSMSFRSLHLTRMTLSKLS